MRNIKYALVILCMLLLPAAAAANPLGAIARHINRHKLFYGLTAAYAASSVLDVRSTEAVFNRCHSCYEAGFARHFVGRRPSAVQLYGYNAAIYAPVAVLNWYVIKQADEEHDWTGRGFAIGSTVAWSGAHIWGWQSNKHICPGGQSLTTGACR